jgi:hypothetical protein
MITKSLVYLKENQHLPEERELQTAWHTLKSSHQQRLHNPLLAQELL